MCISLARRFTDRTAGPSHKALYWNHGLRWQTSLVYRSCGKWHAICSIWLLQCVLCWWGFLLLFFEHVILRSNWNVLHFYIPDGSRFLKCSKNRCFFWSFHYLHMEFCFSPFCSVSSNVFWVCLVYLAVIILPFYCNAIIVWSLEIFCLVSQAVTTSWQKGVQFLRVDVLGGLLSQLLFALHPLVLFIAMWLTSEDTGYDWVGVIVTECIVRVSGYDPLTFLSCPFSFFESVGVLWPQLSKVLKVVRWAESSLEREWSKSHSSNHPCLVWLYGVCAVSLRD